MNEITNQDDGPDFEERADQLTDEQILSGTIVEDHFDEVNKALIRRGLVLIVGPRGCGKTHMMRYASLVCRDKNAAPFALYVSFNRYLRLEPLLGTRSDAMIIFHAWVLALICVAASTALDDIVPGEAEHLFEKVELTLDDVKTFIDRAERGATLSSEDELVVSVLSLATTKDLIRDAASRAGRNRSIILLDDAALTLTPDFLVEFFDIVRVLKASDISPKASVYPGTTEYGPRFHADHEGRIVPVWLSVTDEAYTSLMSDIARSRLPSVRGVPAEIDRALMYAAFGVPRAYLTMLRQWSEEGRGGTDQAGLNRLIQEHRDGRWAEYNSLTLKLPKFATLIRTGGILFNSMVDALKQANHDAKRLELQLLIAIPTSNFDAMTQRMVNLLIESGLLREEPEVSHGPDRRYRRFAPHLAALIAERAFFSSRGGGARQIIEALSRPLAKHPVRRSMKNLIAQPLLESIHFDLPACQFCRAERLSDSQRFCHSCGKKLLDVSTFSRCMDLPVTDIPGLSKFTISKLQERDLATIGQLVTLQDPGTELRKSKGVGPARSGKLLERVEEFVDEFLS